MDTFFFDKTKSLIAKWFPRKRCAMTIFYLPLLRLYVFHRFGQYFGRFSDSQKIFYRF